VGIVKIHRKNTSDSGYCKIHRKNTSDSRYGKNTGLSERRRLRIKFV